jgi:hypothetical protein
MSNKIVVLLLCLCFSSCTNAQITSTSVTPTPETVKKIVNKAKVIHVLVALCDNVNQGIVPVPAFLGNGEDTVKNLYWGAMYGVKTYFGKSPNWTKVLAITKPKENVLERIIFKHKTQNVYLVVDAYRGSKMRETINDFFSAITGETLENIAIDGKDIQIMGSANLVAFVGHNGLMDFKLDKKLVKTDEDKRDAIILACASRNYFAEHLKKNKRPTTSLDVEPNGSRSLYLA